MANLYLESLGCNKNLVDSEIMLGKLKEYDIVDDPSSADVMILNTCGFIASAKEESVRAILNLISLKKENALLVVTGCLTQRYKDELMAELPEVDIFSGVGDYAKIDEMIAKKESRFSKSTFLQEKVDDSRVITGSNYHAYIKISEGCNQKCSFCAIPSFKGRLKSRSLESIKKELESLVEQGFYDFSFISQDSSSYGKDLGLKDGLIELIEMVESVKGVKFARILYLYPTTTSDELVRKIINSKIFLNYFDMPIQHINDDMLKLMRRGADKKRIVELLNLMRNSPSSFLRTGFIVGHPGESEDEFSELCEFLESFDFDRISVFAYSQEEDTLAFEMEQIPKKVIEKRLKKIEKISNKMIKRSLNSMLNKEILCQIDGKSSEGEMFFGAKATLWDREIDGEILINDSEVENLEVGKIYRCFISEVAGDKLVGRIVSRG